MCQLGCQFSSMQGDILVMLSYATSLIKWLFGCSLMQASIRTNIHFISPIRNRLHQNSFSTESFFMELFSQNDHSRNNPLYITAKGSVLTQLRRQMQERYEVARVKTAGQFGRTSYLLPKGDKSSEMFGEHSKLDRRERGSKKGSKNIVRLFEEHWKLFGAALRRRMRVREMDKTGAVKSYLNGLWISHLSGDA